MDVRIRIRKDDMSEEALSHMHAALSKALTQIAEDAASEAREIVARQSVSDGHLLKSIGADTLGGRVRGPGFEMVVFSGRDDLRYDEWVEFGTGPHWLPLDECDPINRKGAEGALYHWVRRNLAVRGSGAGREVMFKAPPEQGWTRIRAKTSKEQKAIRRVAFLVARKIARKGIAPKPFMRPALALAEREGPSIIEEHMQEVGL